jgi:hypothetical protein
MNNNSPFNLTIVLPPNRQYYVSYFYPYEFHNNSIYQSKYKSNVTTALEEDWHTADIYNEFWKDNPTRGEPIIGNIYKVPFTFYSDASFAFKACTYFVFSYYENDELKYFVYAMNDNGAHTGSFGYSDSDIETHLKTDIDGSLLVYVGFITDYGIQVYAPGRKIYNYTLGINDILLRGAAVDKCADIGNESQRGKLNNFPDEVLVNGYYIFTSTEGVIDGEYQLADGYNIGTKVPELTTGVLKQGFTLPWAPYANHKYLDTYDEDAYAYIYRFKFTKTNDSDPNRTQYRIIHFGSMTNIDGAINDGGDLWIDSETKELKIWSWTIDPAIRVLKQLPADTLSTWHELVIPNETYGNLKGFYFDGEYFDLVEICGETVSASFRHNTIPGFSDVDGRLGYVVKDKSKILDYAAVHLYSEYRPYVMKDNYFDYYEPILPEPEPEPEPEDLTKYLKNNYYVSNRQEAGTLEYSIDLTKITDIVYVPFITIQEVKNFIRHNELIEGSFFGDINRTDLKFPREMGNLEWVIYALQLNPRIKYTPDSLATFLHQYDEENTYTTPKVGVYLVVDEDLSTIFDKLTQIFNPTFKHVGLLLLEDTSTI